MSELSVSQCNRNTICRQLLGSASAVALGTQMFSITPAGAEVAQRPSVWIELGGQFEQLNTAQEAYSPEFFSPQPAFTDFRPGVIQKPLDFSVGANGSITIQPEGSNWVFSAGVRYGRSNGNKHVHQSTPGGPGRKYVNSQYVGTLGQRQPKFVDAVAKRSQDYGVLDFEAGKDVGLGLFGNDSHSVLSFGVRYAQFHSAVRGTFGLDPSNSGYQYLQFGSSLSVKRPDFIVHEFLASFDNTRSFRGWGPTLLWNGSAPISVSADDREFTIDWGANAALLFGRQKTSVHHQSTAYIRSAGANEFAQLVYRHAPPDTVRSRSATVPNLGGFAGVSLRFPNAKVSLGYRADWFFGAMDGGVGVAKSENAGLHGPFAAISIGFP